MKTASIKRLMGRVLISTCLAVVLGNPLLAVPPKPPQILATKASGSTLLVSVEIPKGWQVVTLESRAQAKAGAWVPRAVSRANGKVVFRVPVSLQGQLLRARGELKEALPPGFYRGHHSFAARRSSFLRPDRGSGEVISVAANGALSGGAMVPMGSTSAAAVQESDIWAFNGDTLYFFNQQRGLQVIDVSNPDLPRITGRLEWPAVGEQMFLLDAQHVILLAQDACTGIGQSELAVVDVSTLTPRIVSTLPIPGWLNTGRLAGTSLYVTSSGYDPGAGTDPQTQTWGTLVSSFDLSKPAAPAARSTLFYSGSANAVLATNQWLFLAVEDFNNYYLNFPGHGVVDVETHLSPGYNGPQSTVHILDCSASDATLAEAGSFNTVGTVEGDSYLGLNGTTLTAVSYSYYYPLDFSGTNTFAGWVTALETFSLTNPAAPVALGSVPVANGQLDACRFSGNLAFVVTSQQTDPLWVVDLSDPANPNIAGSVEVPGWSTYIQPLGNQLLTLGVETNLVEVSLFDVSNPAAPSLLSRVPLGTNYSWSDALSNDKVLTVLSNGVVLVPYSGASTNGWSSQVQIIDVSGSGLTARGQIAEQIAPSRTAWHNGRVLSLSDEDLLSLDLSNQDAPVVRGDLPLAWPVNQLFVQDGYLVEVAAGSGWGGLAQPEVRIAPAGSPDTVLNSLPLTSLPITGATVNNGRLFLLQSPSDFYPILYGGPILAGGWGWNPAETNLLMTIVDLAALPALNVLGQVSVSPADFGQAGGSYQAVWPAPNVLVWFSTGFSFWVNPVFAAQPLNTPTVGVVGLAVSGVGASRPSYTNNVPVGSPVIQPTMHQVRSSVARVPVPHNPATTLNSASLGMVPYWWPWWGNGGVQLLAFDVTDPANPQLASNLNYNPTNSWGFSQPLTAGGLVFFSHEQSVPTTSSENPWAVTDSLDVIDYTDPANPTARPVVAAPGQLTEVSPDTSLLFFQGNGFNSAGSLFPTRTGVTACSYDGVTTYFLASLLLPATWPQPVVVTNNTVYLGWTSNDGTWGALQSWGLSGQARFALNYSVNVPSPLSALGFAGGALLGQDSANNVNVYNPETGALLKSSPPPGCTWINLNRAEGSLETGLFLPLDDYGVFQIP